MVDFLKSMLVGLLAISGFLGAAALFALTLPWSGYVVAGALFLGVCAALGSDLRSGKGPR